MLRHDPAQLSCNVQGAKHINWFHKGQSVTTKGGTIVSLGTLFILSANNHDAGVYWCEGVADSGKSVRSNNATLKIACEFNLGLLFFFSCFETEAADEDTATGAERIEFTIRHTSVESLGQPTGQLSSRCFFLSALLA